MSIDPLLVVQKINKNIINQRAKDRKINYINTTLLETKKLSSNKDHNNIRNIFFNKKGLASYKDRL